MLLDKCLTLSPNLAQAWMFSGWVKAWMGEADLGIARVTRALQLSPHDPALSNMRRGIAFCYFIELFFDRCRKIEIYDGFEMFH